MSSVAIHWDSDVEVDREKDKKGSTPRTAFLSERDYYNVRKWDTMLTVRAVESQRYVSKGASSGDVVIDSPTWLAPKLGALGARGFARINDPRRRR